MRTDEGERLYPIQRPAAAFCSGATVAILGGLIGLGGAELRLPLLISVFGLYPHRAVRINLLISLATLAVAAISRLGFAGASNVPAFQQVIVAMIAGGVVSAWAGAGFLSRIPKHHFSSVIAVLLLLVAALLLGEALFPLTQPNALLQNSTMAILAALGAGLLVGAISSLLGVAGGEFIIPILIFVFGADVKTAGTASLLISTPLVVTGIVRHILGGKFRSHTVLTRLVIPMSTGSVAGALLGALLAASAVKLLRAH